MGHRELALIVSTHSDGRPAAAAHYMSFRVSHTMRECIELAQYKQCGGFEFHIESFMIGGSDG